MQFKTINSSEFNRYLLELAKLRITVFREFPYLYDGTEQSEREYLETYIQSPSAMAVLAIDGKKIVGASTGIPMADETEEFKRPFIQNSPDPASIFYCGESVLLPEYRGRGIYRHFMNGREEFARTLSAEEMRGITHSCFCAVVRPDDHPLKPANYVSLDEVWKRFGYEPRLDLMTTYPWKDIDQDIETQHPMMFWVKEL